VREKAQGLDLKQKGKQVNTDKAAMAALEASIIDEDEEAALVVQLKVISAEAVASNKSYHWKRLRVVVKE
jgi:formaldehyde-activating enzyme involved in methanogenesis